MTEVRKKLSNLVKGSFILPTLGQNLFIYLELYYMSYFLTDICQFEMSTVTFILTSTAAVDLVWVFVTGIVLEKFEFKKLGKYRAWYIIGSPIIIVFFTLMFTNVGNGAAAAGIVIIAFCIKTLFQDIQSAAVTAQLSQLSDDQKERKKYPFCNQKYRFCSRSVCVFICWRGNYYFLWKYVPGYRDGLYNCRIDFYHC